MKLMSIDKTTHFFEPIAITDDISIDCIKAFNDNYIWVLRQSDAIYVVDPGDASPVIDFLKYNNLRLEGILITHWHPDHTGGIDELKQFTNAQLNAREQHSRKGITVYGPKSEKIEGITLACSETDEIQVFNHAFKVLEVPAHTLDHIVYFSDELQVLFSGDTLFAAGCGRVFEGSNQQMLNALTKLAALPAATTVFCTHEYTLSNLRFAQAVEPNNALIADRIIEAESKLEQDRATLPTTIALELASNPFLRCQQESVIASALNQGASSDAALDVFTTIREWKNQF